VRFETLILEEWGSLPPGLRLVFPGGTPDLHVLLGRNEAGKSTLLRAFTAAMFGVDAKDAERCRAVAAEARGRDGAEVAWQQLPSTRRVPAPLPEPVRALLAGADRERWTSLFGFADTDLDRGAERLRDLPLAHALDTHVQPTRAREVLDQAAELLYTPRSTKRTLNMSATRISELEGRLREAVLLPQVYAQREESVREATSREEAARQQQAARVRELDRARRLSDARPALLERADRLRQRELVPVDPRVTPALGRRLAAVREQRDSACQQVEHLALEGAAAADRLAQVEVREEVLAAEPLVRRLAQGGHRWEPVAAQLPHRRALAREHRAAATRLAAEWLPRAGAASALPAQVRAEVAELHRRWVAASSRLEQERHPPALPQAGESEPVPVVHPALTAALQAAKAMEGERGAIEAGRVALARQQEAVARLARELRGWGPRPIAEVPRDAQVAEAEAELVRLRAARDAAESELAKARKTVGDLRAHLAEGEGGRELPSEAELARVRVEREGAWARLRRGLLEPGSLMKLELVSAVERFETLATEADRLGDALRTEALSISQHRQRQAQLRVRQGEEDEARRAHADAQDRLDAWTAAWTARWSALGSAPDEPTAMRDWLRSLTEWDRESAAQAALAAEVAGREAKVAGAEADLRQALVAAGRPATGPWAQLQAEAEAWVRRCRDAAIEREATLQAEAEQRRRAAQAEAERARLQADLAQDSVRWAELLAQYGGPEGLPPEQAPSWLEGVAQAGAAAETAAREEASLAEDERGYAAWVAEVEGCPIPTEEGGSNPFERTRQLDQILAQAREQRQARAERQAALDRANAALATGRLRFDALGAEVDGLLLDAGGIDEDTAARGAQAAVLAATLDEQIAALDLDLARRRGAPDPTFDAEALSTPEEDLRARIADLEHQRAAADEARARAQRARWEAEQALGAASGAGAAAAANELLIQARRELQEGVREWLTLRLARRLVDEATRRVEQDQLPAVEKRIGGLFARLTGGRYVGVDGVGADLVALRFQGAQRAPERLSPAQLSDGTRHQLYLAARLAWAEAHNARAEPLPFVLDDVLSAFDAERAALALEVLAEVARGQQVILLTHHRYIRDLATQTPGARVQELEA